MSWSFRPLLLTFVVLPMLGCGATLQAADLINGLGGTAGFGEGVLPPGDDNSNVLVNITSVFPGGINFYGITYTSLWVNTNGNVTFDGQNTNFTPANITSGSARILAPFYADVDTRGGTGLTPTPGGTSTGSNRVYYDLDAAAGIFTVTWDDVGYFASHTDLLNAFQLRLKRRSGGGFIIEFRYESINWTTGDANGGSGGFGGTVATAGWSGGDGVNFSQIAGAGDQTAVLAWDTTFPTPITFVVNADGTIGSNNAPVATASATNARQTVPASPRDFNNMNGADPDGDALIYLRENPLDVTKLIAFPTAPAVLTTTLGGTVLMVNNTVSPPILRYTPPAGVAVPFDDTFRFGAQDIFGRFSNHAVYTFHVAANVAPVGTTQTINVYANEPNVIGLNATDANSDPLTYTAGTPSAGTVSGTAPSYIYTPPANFVGTATITFTASDGLLTSPSTTLTLNVIVRPQVTMVSPNGNEVLAKNAPLTLTWNYQGAVTFLSFYYSADGGSTWVPLSGATHVASDHQEVINSVTTPQTLLVTAPDVDSASVLISVTAEISSHPSDITNAAFTVGNPSTDSGSSGCGSGSGLILGLLSLSGLYLRRSRRSA